jgi:hypothetical protein
MTEKCPLSFVYEQEVPGFYGAMWDTGLPDECRLCLRSALDNPRISKEVRSFNVSDDANEDDRYLCMGVKPIFGTNMRLGYQETGIDIANSNEGPIETFTLVRFKCPKDC